MATKPWKKGVDEKAPTVETPTNVYPDDVTHATDPNQSPDAAPQSVDKPVAATLPVPEEPVTEEVIGINNTPVIVTETPKADSNSPANNPAALKQVAKTTPFTHLVKDAADGTRYLEDRIKALEKTGNYPVAAEIDNLLQQFHAFVRTVQNLTSSALEHLENSK